MVPQVISLMPQRRSIVFGSIFVAGLMVIAWTDYYPRSPMFATLGMAGPRANSGRECQSGHEPTFMGWLTRRSIQCRAMWLGPDRFSYFESANLAGLSRILVRAGRGWTTLDSTQWRVQRDSIVTAIQQRGGREFACKYAPQSDDRVTYRYWRFPNYYVRLVAYIQNPYSPTVGEIHVEGSRTIATECLRPPPDLTADGQGCGAETLFQMPLPGNRAFCVRSWFWE